MRHRVKTRTLGRPQGHRLSMLRNMARSLLQHQRITTTHARAQELSSFVEPLITSAVKAHNEKSSNPEKSLAHKRQVFRHLLTNSTSNANRRSRGLKTRPDRAVAQQLFDMIAPLYAEGGSLERPKGGYTRIIRLYPRKGDGAEMAMIELVGGEA